jgi:hypothetical protein
LGCIKFPIYFECRVETTTGEMSTPTAHTPPSRTLLLSRSGLIFIVWRSYWLDSGNGRLITPIWNQLSLCWGRKDTNPKLVRGDTSWNGGEDVWYIDTSFTVVVMCSDWPLRCLLRHPLNERAPIVSSVVCEYVEQTDRR